MDGVLAPAAPDRDQIVPGPSPLTRPEQECGGRPASPGRRHRIAWARFIARVFQADVTQCPAYGGHMRITAGLAVLGLGRGFLTPL